MPPPLPAKINFKQVKQDSQIYHNVVGIETTSIR